MIVILLQVSLVFLIPLLIVRYSNFVITRWIGTIGTAYFLGIIVAVIIFLINKLGVVFSLNTDVGEIGSHAAIAIAIPLLLFSSNLMETKKLSKTILKSFLSLLISAIVVSAAAFYIYGRTIIHGAELSGMAIGLYTGGTPNLNAIGNIFGLEGTVIGVANLSDMVIGAVFYLFLLLGCKPLLSKFLKAKSDDVYVTSEISIENIDKLDIRKFTISYKLLLMIILAFGMALAGAIIGLIIWMFLGSVEGKLIDILVPSLMVTVTVFGIVGSFSKKIRDTKGMNVVGHYFILVFSFALASSLDFTKLQGLFGDIIILYGMITSGVFILHSVISWFMKIDTDCTMVTLTAGVYGPAFVPAITKQIKNDSLTAPGLIVGSIGYAVGTFLGMLLGLLFML
ncbi:DUF819 family protein [Mycoplasmatota bacterium WC44]